MKILLGSQSPRRKKLLEQLDIQFKTVTIECEENYPKAINPRDVAAYLSKKKSMSYSDLNKDELLITADTVVIIQNEILNKPKDYNEAKEMLEKLSDKTHEVYTGVTLRSLAKQSTFSVQTYVELNELSDKDINYYISNFHPFDKAGSYGIQDWIGLSHISSIKGCYYNVMGLPTSALYKRLKNILGRDV
ncbi:Maf family nucleotide pyrophosphatase [Bacteroidia bacterium]|jgi:septum formation protein|nr:Maf family nucleotide pyrophosphatase [Bacteroidia bacterium]